MVVVCGLLACATPDDDTSPASGDTAVSGPAVPTRPIPPLQVASGTLHQVDGELRFVPCGEAGEGTAVADATNGEAAAILQDLAPGGRVTALVELEGNRLVGLPYAAPEGASCTELPPQAELEARGQEPFWYVSISGIDATVRTPEELDGVRYTNGQWTGIDASRWQYAARRGDQPLLMEITRERCVDPMSGARYPLRATLTRDGGSAMQGCALSGN
jgi:uncharacterized membrane protein